MRARLTIIIPAKHEEASILEVLQAITKSVKTPHRILVVNDTDKSDRTAIVVRAYMRRHRSIALIHRISSKSTFASALRMGLAQTRTPLVAPVMADLCDDPADIDRMVALVDRGWDVVCASRYMKGGEKDGGPLLQSMFSRFVCTSLRLLTGIPTWDVSNAYKMYKTDVMRHIAIDPQAGVEVSMDIVLTAYQNGAAITELPTKWMGRTKGESKFKVHERFLRYLRIYIRALTSRYLRIRSMSPHPATG